MEEADESVIMGVIMHVMAAAMLLNGEWDKLAKVIALEMKV